MAGVALLAILVLGPFLIAFGLSKAFGPSGTVLETAYVIASATVPAIWLTVLQRDADAFSRAGTAMALPLLLILMTIPAWVGVHAAHRARSDGPE
jgi:hypothetical protein